MPLPVFSFNVDANNATRTNSYRTKSVQYGDGYKQLALAGINNKLDTWDLTLPLLTDAIVIQVEAFFDVLGQHKNFSWTPPRGVSGVYRLTSPVKYQAQGLDRSGATRTTVVLSIERVYLDSELANTPSISVVATTTAGWNIYRSVTINNTNVNYTITTTPLIGPPTTITGSITIAGGSSSAFVAITGSISAGTETLTIMSGIGYVLSNQITANILLVPDPLFANVGLLLHLNQNLNDSSSFNLTMSSYGSPVISTAEKQWGEGSLYLDGNSSAISTPSHPIFNVGTGNFCWELFVYLDAGSTSVERNILKPRATGSANGLSILGSQRLAWWQDGTGDLITGTPPQLVEEIWNYIAINRVGSAITIWLNGSIYNTFTDSSSYDFADWSIGENSYNYELKGYVDEIRFTNTNRPIAGIPSGAFPSI